MLNKYAFALQKWPAWMDAWQCGAWCGALQIIYF